MHTIYSCQTTQTNNRDVCVCVSRLLCFVGARLKRAECLRKRELANDDEYTTLSAPIDNGFDKIESSMILAKYSTPYSMAIGSRSSVQKFLRVPSG